MSSFFAKIAKDEIKPEDKSKTKHDKAAENMGILRKWALHTMQKAQDKPDQSLKM
jgi:hypothetical protein